MTEEMKNEEVITDFEADTKSGETIPQADIPLSEEDNTAEPSAAVNEEKAEEGEPINYEKIIADDLAVLRTEFPELQNIDDITELDNPIRYAALRDLGLTPTEAYMATLKRVRHDNRSHLSAAYGKNAATSGAFMSHKELMEAREIFSDLSDSEIQRLYRRVTS